jgi:serine/threonine-protein kinase
VTATSARPAKPRGGLSLATRIFLICSLLVVAAVGAAVVYTSVVAKRVAREAAREDLAASYAAQSAFGRQRSEQLALLSRLFVVNSGVTAYVAEAAAAADTRSLLDLLAENQEDLGFDLAIVLDPRGRVLARTDRPGVVGEDLAGETLVAQALERYEAWGAWLEEGRLYDGVAVPVTLDLDLLGFLVTGFAVTDATARDAMRVSGTEVAVVAERDGAPEVVAATLDAERAGRLLAALRGRPGLFERVMDRGEVAEDVEVSLQGQPWIALLAPVVDAAGEPIGATVALASLDRELAPFRDIERALAVAGVASVLLAFALTFAFARRTLRPVRRLAGAAAAARAGDYDQPIPAEGGGEVRELAAAFDGLLSELREKRDMERYVTELSRSLPERGAGGAEAAAEPPASADAALLAVDYRDLGGAVRTPAEALDRLSRHLRRLAHVAGGRRGEMAAVAGHRAYVRFGGEGRVFRAFAAAVDVISAAASRDGDAAAGAPVAALAAGVLARGPIDWGGDRRPGLVGRPLAQLDGLLREASGGEIVFADDVFGELRPGFERAGYALAERRGVVSPRPLYILTAAAARRLVGGSVEAVPAAATGATPVSPAAPAAIGARPTLSQLAPGRVVGGRFELLAVLGSGGMGVVYKARDRELDEVVAVKMLRPELAGDREHMGRLKDELKLARKITHPNVVRTYDFDEADGLPFISMEYVRGVTLRDLLDRSGRPPYSAGLHLVRQLCRGLAAAHAVGVLHRDIKPENLILEANGNAKLMDFGIARPAVRLAPGVTAAGWLVGTPRYLAPEQLQGRDADQRADVYSAGVVAYEVFTGALPHVAPSVMEAIAQTLHEEPAPPSRHWPEIPGELERILLACLRKAPEERYPDAAGLLADLDRLKA